MKVCRICLSSDTNRKISELVTTEYDEPGHGEIFWFCFGIQIAEDSKVTQELCSGCYEKTLAYCDFKKLALKSNAYLCSLDESSVDLLDEIKVELSDSENEVQDVKLEVETKEEGESEGDEVRGDYEEGGVDEEAGDDEEGGGGDDDTASSPMEALQAEPEAYDTDSDGSVVAELIKNGDLKKIGGRKVSSNRKENQYGGICNKCDKYVRDLKAHAFVHLPMSERRKYDCSFCDKIYATRKGRIRHVNFHHLGIQQHCDICDKVFRDINSHNRSVHVPRILTNKTKVVRRVRSKIMERLFECDECHNKFTTKDKLVIHIDRMHKYPRNHLLCQYCSKQFIYNCALKRHLRIHTKEKPFKCPICSKGFTSTQGRLAHVKTHTKERAFTCDTCNKSYKTKMYLETHKLIHLNLKPYPCQYCGYKFTRDDNRKAHEYRAHEKKLRFTQKFNKLIQLYHVVMLKPRHPFNKIWLRCRVLNSAAAHWKHSTPRRKQRKMNSL